MNTDNSDRSELNNHSLPERAVKCTRLTPGRAIYTGEPHARTSDCGRATKADPHILESQVQMTLDTSIPNVRIYWLQAYLHRSHIVNKHILDIRIF